METVMKVKTKDGELFNTTDEAIKHIDVLIGETLSPLCHKMTELKWSQLPEFIMNHLDDFSKIIQLDNDKTLIGFDDAAY